MNLKLLESMHKLELLEKYLIKFKFVYILLILIIIIGFTSQIYIYRKQFNLDLILYNNTYKCDNIVLQQQIGKTYQIITLFIIWVQNIL